MVNSFLTPLPASSESYVSDTEENLDIANENLSVKVLEVSNLKAACMDNEADMTKLKERIEFLSRPNKQEQILEETIEQLQADLRQQESENELLCVQVKSISLQREKDCQLLDWEAMMAEDTVEQISRINDRKLRNVEAALLSKEEEVRELQKKLEELDTMRGIVQRCEQHLMAHEDRMIKYSNLISRVFRAQKVSEDRSVSDLFSHLN